MWIEHRIDGKDLCGRSNVIKIKGIQTCSLLLEATDTEDADKKNDGGDYGVRMVPSTLKLKNGSRYS